MAEEMLKDLFKELALETLSMLSKKAYDGIKEVVDIYDSQKDIKAINDHMEEYTNTVAKIELRMAKGENKGGYLQKELDAAKEGLPMLNAAVSRMLGLKKAINDAESSGENENVIEKLNKELEGAKQVYEWTRKQKALDEEAAAGQKSTETKKPSRKTGAANQCEERTQTVQVVYDVQNEEDIVEKFLADLEEQEKIAKEKAKTTQEQIWRIREAYATTDAERDAIAIERIKQKYEEELKLAEETGVEIAEIEKAQAAEIEAIKNRTIENEKAKEKELQEHKLQLRDAYTVDEEGRLEIQRERINARYDEQLEKAKENSELTMEIERARAAEIARIEEQLAQARINSIKQYTDSIAQTTKDVATLLRAGGTTMKGIAISEATINTALAVTKALSTAAWPLSLVLAAGAAASGAAQIATISRQTFAQGGIVNGNSFYGDQVPVMANSGEMILNKDQQKTLLGIASGKERDNQPQVNVTFAPNISQGINSEDVKKMLRENQSLFRSFLATEVSKGLSSAGAFA
jgi:hypothetical protein